jgi:hypothetical protein
MMYSFPLRRTILQSTLLFLMDALTFIFLSFERGGPALIEWAQAFYSRYLFIPKIYSSPC